MNKGQSYEFISSLLVKLVTDSDKYEDIGDDDGNKWCWWSENN